jgi:hypothetical protein
MPAAGAGHLRQAAAECNRKKGAPPIAITELAT